MNIIPLQSHLYLASLRRASDVCERFLKDTKYSQRSIGVEAGPVDLISLCGRNESYPFCKFLHLPFNSGIHPCII